MYDAAPAAPDTLPTPRLVVDLAVVERNLEDMAAWARDRGLRLRPHTKTHKCPALADLQRAAGATGLTVATVAEAEVFAGAGFDDLFVAYPLWLDPERAARVRALAERVTLAVGTDSLESGRALAAGLGEHVDRVDVLVEVDSGQHRSGVLPEEAGPLAQSLVHSGLRVTGVFTFPGHGYSPDGRDRAAADEAESLGAAAESMRESGVEPRVVSGGSTPTVALTRPDVLTEVRPGVYVFNDAQQWELGVCGPDRIALTAWSTVVSRRPGTVVLDAGSKVLGADRAPWATGHGRLLDHPDARVVELAEHHATVAWDDSAPLPEVGSRLRVVPNHVCNAVNLADSLLVLREGTVVDDWPIAARGANT